MINRQMQPCPFSCVSTCLAMILDRPASEVIDQLHKPYRDGDITLREMMDFLKIEYVAFYSLDCPPLADEGVYFCTAPSLNIEGGNHQILIEVTEDGYFVHDPVQGREAKKYYVPRGKGGDDPFAVDLGGFVVDAFVSSAFLRDARGEQESAEEAS